MQMLKNQFTVLRLWQDNFGLQDAAAIHQTLQCGSCKIEIQIQGCLLAAAGEGSHAAGCHGHRQQGPLAQWRTCAQEAKTLESFHSEQSRWATPPDQLPCGAWTIVTEPYLEAAVFFRLSHNCINNGSPTFRASCIFSPLQVLPSPLICQHLSSSPACQSQP